MSILNVGPKPSGPTHPPRVPPPPPPPPPPADYHSGSTEPEGALALPGMEPYGYEPRRLVADNDGHVIEQAKAKLRYKAAEAERAREAARRQTAWADRKSTEEAHMGQWAYEQLTSGRPEAELVFGAFVHEAGLWLDQAVPSEPDPEDQTS